MTTDHDIIAMARTGMSYRAIAAKVGVSFGTVRRRIAIYRAENPESLPYRYAAVEAAMRYGQVGSAWSAERDALLSEEWPQGTPWEEVLAAINELAGPEVKYNAMAMRAAKLKLKRPAGAGGRPATVSESIFSQSCRWEDACDAAGLRFDDIPDPDAAPPPRRGIMSGKPPNHSDMVAARVAMASQARMAVAEVGVRGLV